MERRGQSFVNVYGLNPNRLMEAVQNSAGEELTLEEAEQLLKEFNNQFPNLRRHYGKEPMADV